MGKFNCMLAVFLLGLVLTTNPAKAIDCVSVISNVFSCSNFLKNPTDALPASSCCISARNWLQLGEVDGVCKCIQPIVSQFLHPKIQQLPSLCNLGAEFLPLVKCLVPPSTLPPLPYAHPAENQENNLKDGLLPPLPPLPFGPLPPLPFGPLPPLPFGPLPPLPFGPLPPLPFGPLPPLPFGPLPPLPFGPLPPLPFTSPAKNEEEKKSEDGLLPPLPPLPPIFPLPQLPLPPFGPLPPLPLPPFVPLPPLPFVPPAEKQD